MSKMILTAALISVSTIFAVGCATLGSTYHKYLMKGSVISATGTEGVICIGSKDGATVGQSLKAYRATWKNEAKGPKYIRTDIGSVKIIEIIDEHFAKVAAESGKIEVGNIVELEAP